MRNHLLIASAMMLAGCLAATDDAPLEDDEPIEVGSQALDETVRVDLVFEDWRQIQAVRDPLPELYDQNVDLLVESGVGCNASGPGGHCLTADASGAEVMMQQGTSSCTLTCSGARCASTCCITVIYEICGTTAMPSGKTDIIKAMGNNKWPPPPPP